MDAAAQFVLEVRGVSKTYTQGKLWQRRFHCRALDNMSLSLPSGKTLALVGESGSGKTTLAMCMVGLETIDAGEILLNGASLQSLPRSEQIVAQREIQLIFQDSAGALNPRMSAIEIVEEPLLIRGQGTPSERKEVALEMMDRVGISPRWKHRRPCEFSGGQRQRLAIARALVLQPKVLILDEVFVGLDLSIQGQIANLLLDLQETHGLSYICISHNLAVAAQFADTVAIMAHGRIVEQATPEQMFTRNQNKSTPALAGGRDDQKALGAYSGA
jgi:oligopeptide transport system ATP-binding protein